MDDHSSTTSVDSSSSEDTDDTIPTINFDLDNFIDGNTQEPHHDDIMDVDTVDANGKNIDDGKPHAIPNNVTIPDNQTHATILPNDISVPFASVSPTETFQPSTETFQPSTETVHPMIATARVLENNNDDADKEPQRIWLVIVPIANDHFKMEL